MSEHLVECGMELFKYLRQLQVGAGVLAGGTR